MLDNTKKLHLALKILETLQEDDLLLADAEEILRRTLAMLQAWHSEKGGAGR
jgi:predicted KAP-like P-loop ATPase